MRLLATASLQATTRTRLPTHLSRLALLVLLGAGTGCLSHTYELGKEEILRIASLPPEQKGQTVLVTQRLGQDEEPPGGYQQPGAYPGSYGGGSGVSTSVGISAGMYGSRGFYGGGMRPYPYAYPPTIVAPPAAGPVPSLPATPNPGRRSGDKSAAVAALVVGGLTGFALAFTEGLRFDGWIQLTPSHPVHLISRDGSRGWVPIAGLGTDAAAFAESGYVTEYEGPLVRGPRAPLNRKGFAFTLELGAAGLNAITPASLPWGFAGTIGGGYFPTHYLGLLVGLGIGIGDDEVGNGLVDWRPHFELQLLPLDAGIVHFGAYGRFGYNFGGDLTIGTQAARRSLNTPYGAAGGLIQFELTTRLALTVRGGANFLPGGDELHVGPEFMMGLAVY